MVYDSKEEEYFHWWLAELMQAGVIAQVKYHPKPFSLSTGTDLKFLEIMKRKTKERSVSLLKGHEYQADFLIYWTKQAKNIIFADYNEVLNESIKKFPFVANYSEEKDIYFSVVDVKGTFNQNDAWRRFSIDQKWVFQRHGIYVQKIITHPNPKGLPATALFPKTFIPRRFQTTDLGKKKRKIHYKHIFVEEYLKNKGLR